MWIGDFISLALNDDKFLIHFSLCLKVFDSDGNGVLKSDECGISFIFLLNDLVADVNVVVSDECSFLSEESSFFFR